MADQPTTSVPNKEPGEMFFKSWDLRLAVIGTALTLLGLLFTSVLSLKTQRDTVEQAKREANRSFHEKQLDLYIQASGTVSTMATTRDPKAWKEAYFKFLQLHDGPLFLVESDKVRDSMGDIRKYLFDCGVMNRFDDNKPVKLTPDQRKELEFKSIDLATIMFSDTKGWWEFDKTLVGSHKKPEQ